MKFKILLEKKKKNQCAELSNSVSLVGWTSAINKAYNDLIITALMGAKILTITIL